MSDVANSTVSNFLTLQVSSETEFQTNLSSVQKLDEKDRSQHWPNLILKIFQAELARRQYRPNDTNYFQIFFEMFPGIIEKIGYEIFFQCISIYPDFLNSFNREGKDNNPQQLQEIIEAYKKGKRCLSELAQLEEDIVELKEKLVELRRNEKKVKDKKPKEQNDFLELLNSARSINSFEELISLKTKTIALKRAELKRIYSKIEFSQQTLNVLLYRQNNKMEVARAYKNMLELIKFPASKLKHIKTYHIAAMLSLVSSDSEFQRVFAFLASDSHTRKMLIRFLTVASRNFKGFDANEHVVISQIYQDPIHKTDIARIDRSGFSNACTAIYGRHLLHMHENNGGKKFLSRYPEIADVLFRAMGEAKRPREFALGINEIIGSENQLNLLKRMGRKITPSQAVYLACYMTDLKVRKAYFSKGHGLQMLRMGVDQLINEGYGNAYKGDKSINAENQKLLLDILRHNDLRGWIDLARKRDYETFNYVDAWLERSTKESDGEVAKIVSGDRRLMSAIQGDQNAQYFKFENSPHLYAANVVLTGIKNSPAWFESGKKDDYLKKFWDSIKDKESISLEEKAVCDYIDNNKDLRERLENIAIRKKSWLWGGASDSEIRSDESKLASFSKHFKQKLTVKYPNRMQSFEYFGLASCAFFGSFKGGLVVSSGEATSSIITDPYKSGRPQPFGK